MRSKEARPMVPGMQRLRALGLRPTRQRLALCRCLYSGVDRHVTAEALHEEVLASGITVSLATVYNTLHQFTAAGLLREVVIDGAKTYFDTNTNRHHHFFCPASGTLSDIPGDGIEISGLPGAPRGYEVESIDVVVRIRGTAKN